MTRPADHPAAAHGKTGVLLINLGTPDAPTPAAVRRYLAEFLSDRDVVELPPLLWQPILRGIILNVRPARTAKLYASVWDHDANASPLLAITRAQATALKDAFGPDVIVDYAMRYGNPSIPAALDRLREQGCDRLLIAPLYPQYCLATTGTALKAVFRHLSRQRWLPAVRTLPPYHDDPAYIGALAQSARAGLAGLDFKPEVLLASFHGMPRVTLKQGDPYHCHCIKTARLLREALDLTEQTLRFSFQSRFGRQEWLRPYSIDLMSALPAQGVKSLAVIAPGFSADCLETLEEIRIELRSAFLSAGGSDFAYLPCLNASETGVAMLHQLISRQLRGWSADTAAS
jgi:protoporphyrin/coproporphyrin ferrochelatase